MTDQTRREPIQFSAPTPTEASFLGGILRKGETIEGWVVESKIQVASGEAELYIAKKGGQTAVVKYYRQNVVPKEEILAKLAAFKHEDIIQLLAYGTYNGLFYEVMEFAAGGGLDSRDAAGKSKYLPLDEGQVIQMVREVNNAYKACHAIGIIHRDIKPANIFLRNTNGMDYVIGDFGISSLLDVEGELSKRLTRNASRTEGYAAPEIYSGVVGSEVDYYALGVTVWEVMTGLNAFEGRNTQFIIRDTMEGWIADDLLTRAEAKGFSSRLQTLIRGLLTHRHDKRWGYQQIEDWLAGKDVEVFAAPMLAAIPPFTFEGKKFETAAALAVELLAQPEKAQKYLYRGLIEGWLAAFDQAMAMEVGDIKEGLGDSEAGKVRAVRRVALLLNPGQPMVAADGASMDSIGAFKRILETRPESLVDHLRNPGDALWDFLESWGAGELASSMRESIAGEKSHKRVVNLITVALSGKVIRPFEGTRFAGTELSRIDQLEGLPSELRKRLLMELEDSNGLLAVWLEMASGREYPKAWKSDGVPTWEVVVAYWSGVPGSLAPAEPKPAFETKGVPEGFVLVPGGTFKMGDTFGDDESEDEKPVHEVTLSDYYIGKYEVTFNEYDAFCQAIGTKKPEDADWGRGRRPVVNVSWYDAVEYCNWRSKKDGFQPAYTGSGETIECDWRSNGYRLPTEAEWEYAARGGRSSKGFKYSGSDDVDDVAWYDDNSEEMTHPVGEKVANELGLHDMSGNVWEWCWDRYGAYLKGKQTDPLGAASGASCVFRGGSWSRDASCVRLAIRYYLDPSSRGSYLGIRLVRPSTP